MNSARYYKMATRISLFVFSLLVFMVIVHCQEKSCSGGNWGRWQRCGTNMTRTRSCYKYKTITKAVRRPWRCGWWRRCFNSHNIRYKTIRIRTKTNITESVDCVYTCARHYCVKTSTNAIRFHGHFVLPYKHSESQNPISGNITSQEFHKTSANQVVCFTYIIHGKSGDVSFFVLEKQLSTGQTTTKFKKSELVMEERECFSVSPLREGEKIQLIFGASKSSAITDSFAFVERFSLQKRSSVPVEKGTKFPNATAICTSIASNADCIFEKTSPNTNNKNVDWSFNGPGNFSLVVRNRTLPGEKIVLSSQKIIDDGFPHCLCFFVTGRNRVKERRRGRWGWRGRWHRRRWQRNWRNELPEIPAEVKVDLVTGNVTKPLGDLRIRRKREFQCEDIPKSIDGFKVIVTVDHGTWPDGSWLYLHEMRLRNEDCEDGHRY